MAPDPGEVLPTGREHGYPDGEQSPSGFVFGGSLDRRAEV